MRSVRVKRPGCRWVGWGLVLVGLALPVAAAELPQLQVSPNGRYLMTADGRPFFWLADTAWELFHRLNRDEAVRYLDDRARKGFTVIQAVALAELDGLNAPNAAGHRPLHDNDPTQPDVREGDDNDYWDHVDFVIREANRRGLYVGLLPTWGDKWNQKWGVGPEVFTPSNAETYGEWLGTRYKEAGLVWILGGDRPLENDTHRDIMRAMARGLKQGDGSVHLKTWHPTGGAGSSQHFHAEDWLDFNMRQNGHVPEFTGRYDATAADYRLTPTKPVVDGEPLYEDHPVSFKAKDLGHSIAADVRRPLYWNLFQGAFGHSIAADVRRPLYWNLFQGAFGHTYGHHSVWQMWALDRKPVNDPLLPWFDALDQPGAGQMQFARWLIESRPFLNRIPDDSVIVTDRVATRVPGSGRYHLAATRDSEGTYAMVYVPVGRTFQVRMEVIRGSQVTAWWYNPRNGQATLLDTYSNQGVRTFTPPDPGEMIDWVLVLDDAAQGYPAPGKRDSR